MPSFAEYKEIARERGALAFEVFIVFSKPIAPPEEFSKHLPDHLAYIGENEQLGNVMLSGPLSDEAGQDMSGIGFQVWRAESWEAAKAFADGDPMHVAGVKTYELRRWLINEGHLNIQVGLSGRHVSIS